MSDVKALVAEAREFADRNNGLNWQRMVRDLADALEASVQDAWEVEARGLESLIEQVTEAGLVQMFGGEKFVSVALLVSEARAQQVREGN